MERGKRAWTRSGRASVVRSQSAGSRPRSASRRQPPTTYAACPPRQRVVSRSATGAGISSWGSLAASSPPRPASVAKEKVRAPALVAFFAQIRGEDGIDIAARLDRSARQPELRFVEELAALAVVAGLASGDEVLPAVGAAAVARHDVIEGEVAGLAAAVLAGIAIAAENLSARQLDPRPRLTDLVLEADHGGRAVIRPRRPDQLMVVFEHFCSLPEHQPEGARQIAHVQWLVVLIEHKDHAVH